MIELDGREVIPWPETIPVRSPAISNNDGTATVPVVVRVEKNKITGSERYADVKLAENEK